MNGVDSTTVPFRAAEWIARVLQEAGMPSQQLILANQRDAGAELVDLRLLSGKCEPLAANIIYPLTHFIIVYLPLLLSI